MTYVLDKLAGRCAASSISGAGACFRPRSARLRRSPRRRAADAGLLLLWEIAPRAGWMNPIFFPPLYPVLAALWELIASGQLGQPHRHQPAARRDRLRLAVVVAIPLGFLMGRYAPFERATDLLVQTLRNTSQFALLPVFVLLLGIGEASKIAITFYAAVFFLLVNTIVGVKCGRSAAAQGSPLDGHLGLGPLPQGDLPVGHPLDRRRRPARREGLALLGDRRRDARGAVGDRLPDPALAADARSRRTCTPGSSPSPL